MSAPQLDQRRAARAWSAVRDVRDDEWDEFRSRVRNLPAMLQGSGLLATLSLLAAKRGSKTPLERAYGRLHDELADWLRDRVPALRHSGESIGGTVAAVAALDPGAYAVAHQETQYYAGWLKRAVEARSVQGEAPDDG